MVAMAPTDTMATATGRMAVHRQGKPCKHCGDTLRYVSSANCVSCAKVKGLSDAHRKATRKWYAANSEKHKFLRDKYRSENRVSVRAYNREWRLANLKTCVAYTQAYNARKKKALPAWADLKAIERLYENCPEGMQVDHELPLRGKFVSGLHVEANLQYLPGVENNRKGNRYAAA